MLSVEDAIFRVLSSATLSDIEEVPLSSAIGRILAQDVYADRDLPPFNRAVMDGIAIAYASYKEGQRTYKIVAQAHAGQPRLILGDEHTCIEIMTGAPLPVGTDTVIRYEDIKINQLTTETVATLQTSINENQSVHAQGSDHNINEILLSAGLKIKAIDINILASVGYHLIKVRKLPRVAVISTGDELVRADQIPADYQIRMSNNHMIVARLSDYGIRADLHHLSDDENIIRARLHLLLGRYDVLLISGGVSKGKFDFIPQILDELNAEKMFHGVAQRPGKPFWFGRRGKTIIFAFPGNPISTLACFHVYFLPWFFKKLGIMTSHWRVKLNHDITFKPQLGYFALCTIKQNRNAQWCASIINSNGSGDIINPSRANGFIILPVSDNPYLKGEIYPFIPFHIMT